MKQKIAELINIIFGFRKFLLMLMLYLVGIIFRCKDLVSGAEMVDLFKTTTIAFMGANGVEHLVTTVKDYMGSKSSPQVADTDESNDDKEVTTQVEG
jgi:hypothetical protein